MSDNNNDITMQHVGVFGVSRITTVPFNNNDTTTLCPLDVVPSMNVYFSAINIYGAGLFTIGGFIVVTVLLFYVDILKYIMLESTQRVKTHTAFVLSVYPVISIVTYCAMIVPRAQLLAEAVTQGLFMAAMYQLFCLFIAYCGGEAELVRRAKPDTTLATKVGPCCCWPCCCLLPKLTIDKPHVCFLRILVLQLPVVQGMVYMILLIMWAEEESLYQVNYLYIQPIIIISILFGVWGMIMTITMLKNILQTHYIQLKFMVLQVVLILAKLQGFITRIISWSGLLPCNVPITPSVYGNLIYNCVMLIEMLLLIIIARIIYKRASLPNTTTDLESNNNNNNNNYINNIDGSFQHSIEQQNQTTGQLEKHKY